MIVAEVTDELEITMLTPVVTNIVELILREVANWIHKQVAWQEGEYSAPIQTGTLRSSIRVEQAGPTEWIVCNDPQVAPYGLFVELGTARWPITVPSKTGHRPFLSPAAEAARDVLKEKLNEAGFK